MFKIKVENAYGHEKETRYIAIDTINGLNQARLTPNMNEAYEFIAKAEADAHVYYLKLLHGGNYTAI